MTPERAAAILRELLQTPPQELSHFARRNGLEGSPTPQDLAQAREILHALTIALASDPGPNWERISTAWSAMRARHGELVVDAGGPRAPAWIRPSIAKPGLGDPAPGTAEHREQVAHRQRFVPAAPPAPSVPHAAPSPHAPPPPPPRGTPHAPTPPSHGAYAAPPPAPPAPSAKPWGPPSYQQAPAHSWQPAPSPYASPQPAPHTAGHGAYAPAPHHHASQPAGYPPAAHSPGAGGYPAQGHAYPPQGYAHPSQPAHPPHQAPSEPQQGGIATSVATYAAFCAACAAQPERVAATMAEYGIAGPDARARLDDHWQDRFDDDPGLQQQWEKLFHQFRDSLRR